ncbi:M23 family metallopeptidase [Bifidobacterium catulorum]|nr:M23 family metallopeptidase [Bifidobacterium catulorum]
MKTMKTRMQRNRKRQFHRILRQDRERRQTHTRLRMLAAGCLICVITIIPSIQPSAASSMNWSANPPHPSCRIAYIWPIVVDGEPVITRRFENPPRPWLPGHRGIDLSTGKEQPIIAPANGRVAFVGKVASKSVVTIRHEDNITTTYEPAVSDLPVGSSVMQGQRFATVHGGSDHCAESCMHWGMKTGKTTYMDPEHAVRPQRIVLKPL